MDKNPVSLKSIFSSDSVPPLISSSSQSKQDCVDEYGSGDCEFYAAVDMCEYRNIKTLCRRTCKTCSTAMTGSDTCRDDKGEYYCRMWRYLGYCTKDKIRNRFCRKTCATCGIGEWKLWNSCWIMWDLLPVLSLCDRKFMINTNRSCGTRCPIP